MIHLVQVGVGSGGILVLDALLRDPRIVRLTILDPDTYDAGNIHRHLFPSTAVGRLKADLAEEWVRTHRPDIQVTCLAADLCDPASQAETDHLFASCTIGVCAADNERAKYHFDALCRKHRKPWTLGEVLSGGIGGWAHRFVPGGPCYGCVASYLQREVVEEPQAPPPDYSSPHQAETRIPASKASIAAIAALHAHLTQDLLDDPQASPLSLLLTLKSVPGLFDTPYRTHRLAIPRSPNCLLCGEASEAESGESLDAALDRALARLGG